jgi:predicted NBD/HSP70 family sugar kinase
MPGGKPRNLKWRNRKVLLDFLRHSDDVAVADISARIGLSKPTVKRMLEHYVETGFVLPVGKGDSTDLGGKKPDLFTFNGRAGFVITIHIFPDEVYAGLFDLRVRLLETVSLTHRTNAAVDTIIGEMVTAVARLLAVQEVEAGQLIGIAVGAHGITHYDEGLVCTSPHFPSWGECVPLRDLLRDKLQLPVPIYIDNQIRFQVFAEKTLGLAKDYKNIVVIEGGIGLVAGIIVKDEIKRGVHYLAGEIGHMILAPDADETCHCGGRGCFEAMVAASRILTMAAHKRQAYPQSRIFQDHGNGPADIVTIFQAANAGDPLACELMDDVIKWFAIGLSNLILVHDPEIIVFQGLYTRAGEYFLRHLREAVNKYSLTKVKKKSEIAYSALGKSRGIMGGAAYVIAQYFEHERLYIH